MSQIFLRWCVISQDGYIKWIQEPWIRLPREKQIWLHTETSSQVEYLRKDYTVHCKLRLRQDITKHANLYTVLLYCMYMCCSSHLFAKMLLAASLSPSGCVQKWACILSLCEHKDVNFDRGAHFQAILYTPHIQHQFMQDWDTMKKQQRRE